MIKSERHEKILELITTENISTQSDLTLRLNQSGFNVTQATASRDLQEMRVTKVLLPDGTYKYAPSKDGDISFSDKLEKILNHCLVKVDYANNIVVLKTMSGAAQAVGYALDTFVWDEIVGTICGDDTIMIVVRNEKGAKQLCSRLAKYIQ
ncbi:MAG: arginine repressor [Clostridia bacterium]|nr:arginine repressor [Clostridia bacterium]